MCREEHYTLEFRSYEELNYGLPKMQETQVDAVADGRYSRRNKHFDFVCEGVAQGIKDLNVLHDIPVILCFNR
jgi:6,7-dimethyl-8-ribityllumazine synthase